MAIGAWQILRSLYLEDKQKSVIQVYLYKSINFSIVDGSTHSSLTLYLIEAPEGFIDLYKEVAPIKDKECCITQSPDLLAFAGRDNPKDKQVWLVQADVAQCLNIVKQSFDRISEKVTELYIVAHGNKSVLSQLKCSSRPVYDCAFWRMMTAINPPAPNDIDQAWVQFLAERPLKPEHICDIIISLGMTRNLEGFADPNKLLRAKNKVLFAKDFWLNRRKAHRLLAQWGFASGQLHPQYTECIAREKCLLDITFSANDATNIKPNLDLSFIADLRDRLVFPMQHSSICPTPKLLIHHSPMKIGIPYLNSDWVTDYIVRVSHAVESVFICELHLVDVLDKYVGESEQNLKDSLLFAEKLIGTYAWVVLIIHDLELLHRNDDDGGVERNLVTNLLLHLDGISKLHKQLVIIGVSKLDISALDEALVRPGRLSTSIPVHFTFA